MEKIKETLKSVFFNKKLIVVLILMIMIIILLSSSYYFITIDDGKWDENKSGNPSNYTGNVNPVDEGGLVVDKDAIIKAGLKDLRISDEEIENMTDEEIIEKLKINEKLRKNPKVTSLDDVTQAEILWCINDV